MADYATGWVVGAFLLVVLPATLAFNHYFHARTLGALGVLPHQELPDRGYSARAVGSVAWSRGTICLIDGAVLIGRRSFGRFGYPFVQINAADAAPPVLPGVWVALRVRSARGAGEGTVEIDCTGRRYVLRDLTRPEQEAVLRALRVPWAQPT